jgi:uncharacterized membrane protein HdeD (DUF308 family)
MMLYLNIKRFSKLSQKQIKKIRKWYLVFGITLFILGILSILSPIESSTLIVFCIGVVLFVTGLGVIFSHINASKIKNWGSFLTSIILGALYCIIGAYFIVSPLGTALFLAFLTEVLFIVIGVLRFCFTIFTEKTVSTKVNLVIAVIEIIIGILLSIFPIENSLFLLASLLGVEFLFQSISFFILYHGISHYLKQEYEK